MLFFHFCCNESFCYSGSVCNISIKNIKRRQLYNSIVFLQYSIVSTWNSKHLFFTCSIPPLLHPKILDVLILLLILNSQTPKNRINAFVSYEQMELLYIQQLHWFLIKLVNTQTWNEIEYVQLSTESEKYLFDPDECKMAVILRFHLRKE